MSKNTRSLQKASKMDQPDDKEAADGENPTVQQLYSVIQKMEQKLCQQMSNLSASMSNLTTSVNTRLDNIDKQISELAHCQEFIAKQYDDFRADHKDHKCRIENLETENKALKATVSAFQTQVRDTSKAVDDLEQYGRREMLEISGIPETPSENTNALVEKVCSQLEVRVCPNDISASHRLPRTKKGSGPIIVKFVQQDLPRTLR